MSPLPFRKLVNAIDLASGDQAGASFPTTTIWATFAPADPDTPPSRSAAAPSAIRRALPMAVSVLRTDRGKPCRVSYTCSRDRRDHRDHVRRLRHGSTSAARSARPRSDADLADGRDR